MCTMNDFHTIHAARVAEPQCGYRAEDGLCEDHFRYINERAYISIRQLSVAWNNLRNQRARTNLSLTRVGRHLAQSVMR